MGSAPTQIKIACHYPAQHIVSAPKHEEAEHRSPLHHGRRPGFLRANTARFADAMRGMLTEAERHLVASELVKPISDMSIHLDGCEIARLGDALNPLTRDFAPLYLSDPVSWEVNVSFCDLTLLDNRRDLRVRRPAVAVQYR